MAAASTAPCYGTVLGVADALAAVGVQQVEVAGLGGTHGGVRFPDADRLDCRRPDQVGRLLGGAVSRQRLRDSQMACIITAFSSIGPRPGSTTVVESRPHEPLSPAVAWIARQIGPEVSPISA